MTNQIDNNGLIKVKRGRRSKKEILAAMVAANALVVDSAIDGQNVIVSHSNDTTKKPRVVKNKKKSRG